MAALGLVVTVSVLWYLLDRGVLGRFVVYVLLRVGLLFVRFWAED